MSRIKTLATIRPPNVTCARRRVKNRFLVRQRAGILTSRRDPKARLRLVRQAGCVALDGRHGKGIPEERW